jgi:signal transduction histidine kinase
MRKQLLHSLILCLSFVGANAQNLDSLKNLVYLQKGSQRIQTLGELSSQIMHENPELAIFYGNLAVKDALVQPDSLLLAQALSDLSKPYLIKGKNDSVIGLNQRAYTIRMKVNKLGLAATNLSNIGRAYDQIGNLKQGIIAYSKACFMYERLADTAQWVQMCNNLGTLFEKYNAHDKSMHFYAKARELAHIIGDERNEALAKLNQSNLYRKAGDTRKAELLMMSVMPYMEVKANANDRAKFYQSFGVLCRLTNRPEEGKEYYLKSLAAYEEQGDELGLANVHRNLGFCFGDLNQQEKALFHFEEALFYARKNNLLDQSQKILQDLYKWHKLNNNPSKALYYLELQKICADSVYNLETKTLVQNYNTKYQYEPNKNESIIKDRILLKSQLTSVRRTNMVLLGIGIVLFLVIAFGVYWTYYQQKKKQFAQINELAINKERVKISRDLHDNLGSELTYIASEMDLRAYAETNIIQRERLNDIAEKMRIAMRNLQDTIWAIHQTQSSLKQLLVRLSDNTKSILEVGKIQLVLPETIPLIILSPAQTLNVYRILKEGITNAIKYSYCSHLLIDVKVQEKNLHLIMRDNGKGFKLEDHYAAGYGLRNMESRANENNIQLIINSSPGHGTELKLYLPIT